jgi:hypothetical protein
MSSARIEKTPTDMPAGLLKSYHTYPKIYRFSKKFQNTPVYDFKTIVQRF